PRNGNPNLKCNHRQLAPHPKTNQWEPIQLDIWRGRVGVSKDSHLTSYDADHYLVKEEVTHYGAKKVIIKNKITGRIEERVI
ncbi:MAG: hypothetical protein ACKO96_02595, partial [Flammeovirgaceae bacterium]